VAYLCEHRLRQSRVLTDAQREAFAAMLQTYAADEDAKAVVYDDARHLRRTDSSVLQYRGRAARRRRSAVAQANSPRSQAEVTGGGARASASASVGQPASHPHAYFTDDLPTSWRTTPAQSRAQLGRRRSKTLSSISHNLTRLKAEAKSMCARG
jgi:hypothetical protein